MLVTFFLSFFRSFCVSSYIVCIHHCMANIALRKRLPFDTQLGWCILRFNCAVSRWSSIYGYQRNRSAVLLDRAHASA